MKMLAQKVSLTGPSVKSIGVGQSDRVGTDEVVTARMRNSELAAMFPANML